MTLTHRRLAAVETPARAEARRGREVRPPVPDLDHGPENRFLEVDRVLGTKNLEEREAYKGQFCVTCEAVQSAIKTIQQSDIDSFPVHYVFI